MRPDQGPRLSDDDLTALLDAHVSYYHSCNRCRQQWPCETVRLATEVRDRRDDEDEVHRWVLAYKRWHSGRNTKDDFQELTSSRNRLLARYEEGGR